MSLTGQGSLSIKKSDLSSDRTSGTYKKVQFAHKATGGETGINLASLTTPSSEMPGFVQPSQAELSACQILFNQKNLVLTSSLRGPLVQFMSYQIASSTQINFTDSFGTALPGEIFVGVIDGTNRDGVNAAATTNIVATGTLSAGSSDFNVGTPFVTNLYPSQQIGAVLVYLDGQLMMRNSGNATAAPSADGNYQEVDSGSGYSNLIRFNVVDNLNDRAVMVVSNGSMVEQPSGSIKATVETLAGQQDAVIQTVAALAGVPTSNFYAAPNNVDMLSFGNSVLALNQNAALKNVSNAWTVGQKMVGLTGADASTAFTPGSGYVGEVKSATLAGGSTSPTLGTYYDDTGTLTLEPGIWMIRLEASVYGVTGAGSGQATLVASIRTGSTLVSKSPICAALDPSSNRIGMVSTSAVVNISTTTVYKASYIMGTFFGSPVVTQLNWYGSSVSALYAIRIA